MNVLAPWWLRTNALRTGCAQCTSARRKLTHTMLWSPPSFISNSQVQEASKEHKSYLNSTNWLLVQGLGGAEQRKNLHNMPTFHLTHPSLSLCIAWVFITTCSPLHSHRKKCAWSFSLNWHRKWSTTLMFPVGHRRALYRFAHLSPTDNLYPSIRTKTFVVWSTFS